MVGISGGLGRYATTGKESGFLDLGFKANPLGKVTLDSILAGSIEGMQGCSTRMASVSNACAVRERKSRLTSSTTAPTQAIREPYREAIRLVVQEIAYTRQGLEDLINNAAFRNCGLVPECEELNTIQGAKAEEEGDPGLGPALQGLTEEERADELRE